MSYTAIFYLVPTILTKSVHTGRIWLYDSLKATI